MRCGLAVAQHIHAHARAIAQRQIKRQRLLQDRRVRAVARIAATSARSISAPVASRACSTRRRLCAASRARS